MRSILSLGSLLALLLTSLATPALAAPEYPAGPDIIAVIHGSIVVQTNDVRPLVPAGASYGIDRSFQGTAVGGIRRSCSARSPGP